MQARNYYARIQRTMDLETRKIRNDGSHHPRYVLHFSYVIRLAFFRPADTMGEMPIYVNLLNKLD